MDSNGILNFYDEAANQVGFLSRPQDDKRVLLWGKTRESNGKVAEKKEDCQKETTTPLRAFVEQVVAVVRG